MLHKNKGFTLIELMIIIAIVGILAAVLIPAISGDVKKGLTLEQKQAIIDKSLGVRKVVQEKVIPTISEYVAEAQEKAKPAVVNYERKETPEAAESANGFDYGNR